MFFGKIIDEIERLKEYVAHWDRTAQVSEIERELVLDKLKKLYDDIKYFEKGAGKPAEQNSIAAVKEEPVVSERFPDDESNETLLGLMSEKVDQVSCDNPAVEETASNRPSAEESLEDAAALAGEATNEELLGLITRKVDQVSCGPEKNVTGETAQDASAMAGDETNETLLGLIGGKVDEVSCGPEETDSSQKLFAEEEIPIRSGVNKNVIMSLYGDDSVVPVSPHTTHASTPEKIVSQPSTPSVEKKKMSEPAEIETNGSQGGKKVFGEVISGNNGIPLNDRIGQEQGPQADLASRLQAKSVTDLRQAIGLNDRFLLIKELFGGDSARCDEAISKLNSFDDLDEALIYIQENYHWNPDSAGVRLLVDLLERKLG